MPFVPRVTTSTRTTSATSTRTTNWRGARNRALYRLHRAGDAPRTLRGTPPGLRQADFGPCSACSPCGAGPGVLGGRSAPCSGRCPWWSRCARCGSLVLADVVDVDHMQPIALGGEDTDTNVQPLCHGCHLAKTAEDFGTSTPRTDTALDQP
ncbi:HNH endonuclease [Streptomyces thermolilacinus]|uniref:HNH endonuclease n=1 Tax=Streptomyces thermolilacinus TaxID=285540 RepID=UPI003406D76F